MNFYNGLGIFFPCKRPSTIHTIYGETSRCARIKATICDQASPNLRQGNTPVKSQWTYDVKKKKNAE